MTIIGRGGRYTQVAYAAEKDLAEDVADCSTAIFGRRTVYLAAQKTPAASLSGAAPAGFLLDLGNPSEPRFHLVEVELCARGFYSRLFPQVTKYFAFFKNPALHAPLVDALFSAIHAHDAWRTAFKRAIKPLGARKLASDAIALSQKILLITDGPIVDLHEVMDTYADTWGRMVQCFEMRKYQCGSDAVFTIGPDLETLPQEGGPTDGEDAETAEEADDELPRYSEAYHLEGVSQTVTEIYNRVKAIATGIDGGLVFDPQEHYITIRGGKDMAFIAVRNKKIRFIVMMPEEDIRKCVAHHPVAALSAAHGFYRGPCVAVDIEDLEHIDEIELLVRQMVQQNTA